MMNRDNRRSYRLAGTAVGRVANAKRDDDATKHEQEEAVRRKGKVGDTRKGHSVRVACEAIVQISVKRRN